MADLEFDVAKRRATPITFTLGGDSALLHPATEAVPATDTAPEQPARDEVRGRDNHEYVFTPPKTAVMLMPLMESDGEDDSMNLAMTRSTFDWLGQGLSEADNARIQARLKDPKDDLDVDLLGTIVQKISEKVGGRPTT